MKHKDVVKLELTRYTNEMDQARFKLEKDEISTGEWMDEFFKIQNKYADKIMKILCK